MFGAEDFLHQDKSALTEATKSFIHIGGRPNRYPRFSSSKHNKTPTSSRPRSNTLQGSFYGILSAQIFMLSNTYEGLSWTEDDNAKTMELESEKDLARVENWASRIKDVQAVKLGQVDRETMRKLLRLCSKKTPTILYLSGHTTKIAGEQVYLPADCFDAEKRIPVQGVSFKEMRKLLSPGNKAHSLLLITDACNMSNFMELPFVLRVKGGRGYWEKTEHYVEGSSEMDQSIIHCASTESTGLSYGSRTKGGFYTQAFCNYRIDEELTLTKRSTEIQKDMSAYMKACAEMPDGQPLDQRHEIYSSKAFDLNDTNMLVNLGFPCVPNDSLP
ncbi:ICE-like protease (caspase) p20 domain protein [Ceratobasidium sp. AG-Ba]|nr:ICE-like protease (caspase) p20 domain protein [Ceratobasidium sp. AG-Ba]